MSKRQGPPKHQNSYAWKPHLGQKINETEPGGRFRPLSEITGVCQRCRDQIDWKRRYGKYKQIVEPAKCQKCGKRAVRQAYHNVCRDCSKNLGICAKCCTRVNDLVGRDAIEEDSERKALEEAIRGARERERRTLLRIMNKSKGEDSGPSVPKIADRSREGDIFPAASLDEYAEQSREQDDSDEEAGDFVED
ncbi:hypothetical protein SEVIR_5G331200v4 [Setaria viridis]|uniref:DUF2039 domain-containing protein n=2 Tax=Setaria TaxID=4554 RepID=K3XTP2_SETIT|nr:uncharacterized protein C9orf85 homolog [Setaria italica]XP_034597909.1 uncharacterized protein C9orf85 homolog [Setaria viridis]RCV27474.1 hypothetical protein SETIT_5G327400v2 [Setaria italica]TKW16920.1 hypothetical protein SEVIR_5G331200v2 [Setaria viridis]